MELPALDAARWAALCQRLAPSLHAAPAFDELEAAHAEKHRAYHNSEHIVECLQRFDEVASLAEHPD